MLANDKTQKILLLKRVYDTYKNFWAFLNKWRVSDPRFIKVIFSNSGILLKKSPFLIKKIPFLITSFLNINRGKAVKKNRSLAMVFHFVPDGDRSMEVFLLELSKNLMNDGWNLIHCYVGEPGESFKSQLSILGVPYLIMPENFNFFSAFSFGFLLRKYKPFVLLTGFYSAFNFSIFCLKIISGAKHLIISDHSSGSIKLRKNFKKLIVKIRGKITGKFIDKIICCSDYVKKRNVFSVFLPKEKICTVHNGIDTNRYVPKLRENTRGLTIVYAGQLIPEKGVEILLEAVSGLEPRPKVRIAGAGPFLNELVLLANNLDVNVEWLGRIDWVPQLFAGSDIAVFPSRWDEAFGFVVAEAMACEACVIASDSGGIPEVVGDAGMIFPNGDVAALRGALSFLINNSKQRELLGRAGRIRVLDRFTINAMVQGYAAVLKNIPV